MLKIIKSKLSLKVAIALALITIPPMALAGYVVTSRVAATLERMTLANAGTAATTAAQAYGAALEAGIEEGAFTLNDVISPVYEEIKGFNFGSEPRFHTKYDFYTDHAVLELQDRVLESNESFTYAVGNDMATYAPTHNSASSQPLTGDQSKDLSGYRSKRRFDNEVVRTAVKNLEPILKQEYRRDTGQLVWDVSSPILVHGKHFGAFRIGVSIESLRAQVRGVVTALGVVFALLLALTVGVIFYMLRRSMKPLERLSELADQISTGENLEQPITAGSSDEIGRMAKSMNRLRASLQAAMSRLGE